MQDERSEPLSDPKAAPPEAVPDKGSVAAPAAIEPTDSSIELCAFIIHKAVEAMNSAHNELTLTWEQSRDSTLAGVRRVLANPKETSEQNHNAWMEYRRSEGWVYGISKDPVKKTHPCMVPYGALPPFQQSKDMVFHAIVRTFFGLEGS